MSGHRHARSAWWVCAEGLSALLDRRERDVVWGDLVESGTTGPCAVAEVANLVVRRQLAAWRAWSPWLAVATIVIPVGLLLSHASRWWADDVTLHVHWYVERWTPAFLNSPGSRHNLISVAFTQLRHALTLVGWSWTAGYALGTLGRRTAGVSVILFALVVACGTLGTTTIARSNDGHDGLFASHLYGVVFPRLMRFVCVLLPAVAGLRYSRDSRPRSRRWTMGGVAVIVLLTVWAARGLEASVTFGRGAITATAGPDRIMGTADDRRPLWPLSLAVLWPSLVVAVRASRHDQPGRA